MTKFQDIGLISVVSVKGGTGKTTTTLSLSSLLAGQIPLTIIEGQRENPQYKSLLFSKQGYDSIALSSHKGDFIQEVALAATSLVYPAEISDNISLILESSPTGIYMQEGLGGNEKYRGKIIGGKQVAPDQLEVEKKAKQLILLADYFNHDKHIIINDYDAGLDMTTSFRTLPFHRAVHGYGVRQAVTEMVSIEKRIGYSSIDNLCKALSGKKVELTADESIFIHTHGLLSDRKDLVSPNPLNFEFGTLTQMALTDEREYVRKNRLGNGLFIFVSSPALAELSGIIDRSYFFRDMGQNNKYILILNQAEKEDVTPIKRFLKDNMKESYMFDEVFSLPKIDMSFGNLRAKGDPNTLPTYSGNIDSKQYTANLHKVAEYILSKN